MGIKLKIEDLTRSALNSDRSSFISKYISYLNDADLYNLYDEIHSCVERKRNVNCYNAPILRLLPIEDPYPIQDKIKYIIELKSIPEDENLKLRGADEIYLDPKLPKKIDKVMAMYKSGFSLEFISTYGKSKGFLRSYDNPHELCRQLKAKGLI